MADESHRYQPPLPVQRSLIDRPDMLPRVAEALLRAPVIGVDVEAGIPPRERHSRFALLQIATEQQTFAVDPLRIRDLSDLAPIFASDAITKVFHGIALDRDMLEGVGLALRMVVDLSDLARSAYGKGEASLAALSRRAFGIGMDKSFQRSDWLHRPISLPLLAYAWRDAELTLALYHWAASEHPDLLMLHTSLEPRPSVPIGAPPWLRAALQGARQSAFDLLIQDGLNVDTDADAVVAAMRTALDGVREPLLRVRLLRVAGELELFELSDRIRASLGAPSAPERAAAARALASMGERRAEGAIRDLLEDPTEEVRAAAALALELLPQRAIDADPEPEHAASL